MNKKVSIATKPSNDKHTRHTDDIIDKWVAGKELKGKYPEQKEVRFTVVLPEDLYFDIKMKAIKEKKKLKELLKSIIESYLSHQPPS